MGKNEHNAMAKYWKALYMFSWLYLKLELNVLNLGEKLDILQLFSMHSILSLLYEVVSS